MARRDDISLDESDDAPPLSKRKRCREAWNVHKLVSRSSGMRRFHEMLEQWYLELSAREDPHTDWDHRRRDHFETQVRNNPLLRDKECRTEPGLDWAWEPEVVNLDPSSPGRGPFPHLHLSGWVPKEVNFKNEPDTSPILPLITDRALSLAEKYVLLASLHDAECTGVPLICPWDWPDSLSSKEDRATWGKRIRYGTLLDSLADLREMDLEAIKDFRRDVLADLEAHDHYAIRAMRWLWRLLQGPRGRLAADVAETNLPDSPNQVTAQGRDADDEPSITLPPDPSAQSPADGDKPAAKRQRPKPAVRQEIRLMGTAKKLSKLIEAEEVQDTGRTITDMLREAGTSSDTFRKSAHFKEARADWARLEGARETNKQYAQDRAKSPELDERF